MLQSQMMALGRASMAGRRMVLQRVQGFATAPAASADGDTDLVLDTFKEQQQQYRNLLEAAKNVQAPLNGDDAAIKKYANEMEGLRKKVGLPDHAEATEALMEYQLETSHGDLRSFLANSLENEDLPADLEGVAKDVFAALDAAEKDGGLRDAGGKGWDQFAQKIGEIQAKNNLDTYDKIKEKAIFAMYKSQLDSLRAKVTEDMETVKRRDHLEWVEVDPATLKATAV